MSDNEKTIGRWGVSEHQPIDLDDLRRVAVKVRWMTDDNWLADMVELACDEISRLREDNDEQCRLHGVGSQRELRQLAVIEEQAREIARLREERRWVPVGEKIPEKYERVILFDPTIPNFPRANTHVVIGHFRGHDDWVSPWFSPDGSGPTHWMPLPPGPEGK